MTCESCKKPASTLYNVGPSKWECSHCRDKNSVYSEGFGVIETMNFKHYHVNNGNVSKKRIEMIKSRCLAPDGNGDVVMKNRFGKITDRPAVNF